MNTATIIGADPRMGPCEGVLILRLMVTLTQMMLSMDILILITCPLSQLTVSNKGEN